jgi:hypothetical protein
MVRQQGVHHTYHTPPTPYVPDTGLVGAIVEPSLLVLGNLSACSTRIR